MKRTLWLLMLLLGPLTAKGASPGDFGVSGGGEVPLGAAAGANYCDKGTIFNALKVVRAYRDNRAFAYTHFEGKQLQISGRLVLVMRDTVAPLGPQDGAPAQQDVFVAIVTPDGKPSDKFQLEFRFPVDKLANDPSARCRLAALWAGQYVTIRGVSRGALTEGEYVGIIFEDSELAF